MDGRIRELVLRVIGRISDYNFLLPSGVLAGFLLGIPWASEL